MKVCSKCNGTKPLAEFAKRKASSDGRQPWCKECQLAYKAENRSRIDAQNAAYRAEHREKTAAYDLAYRAANRERITKREAAYRAANRDWIAAREAAWRANNRERIAEQKAAHYAAHREEIAARDARHRAANPHITWANNYAKRARKVGIDPLIEDFTKADVIERYGDSCTYCGGEFQHLDHYVPINKGGPHTLDNVRPSCASCNRAKGDLPAGEFEREATR